MITDNCIRSLPNPRHKCTIITLQGIREFLLYNSPYCVHLNSPLQTLEVGFQSVKRYSCVRQNIYAWCHFGMYVSWSTYIEKSHLRWKNTSFWHYWSTLSEKTQVNPSGFQISSVMIRWRTRVYERRQIWIILLWNQL